MPNITFSFKDLCELVGKTFKEDELTRLLDCAKAEVEGHSGDEITLKFNDTNQPYLWSVEGIARLLRGVLGKSKGVPKLQLEKSDLVVHVDRSVAQVRPYIALFVAKGPNLSEYLLNQLIQLQEKLASSYGRKRQKVGAGLFPARKVEFPLVYKAVEPTSVSYVPLGMRDELTLKEVLERSQKGKEYAWVLKDAKKYPVVLDNKKQVVTFPPIVNSDSSGKLVVGDSEIVCEVTGTDESAVSLVATIFAYVFADRGFKIFPAKVVYGNKSIVTPVMCEEFCEFDLGRVRSLLGLDLSEGEVKKLLERAQYTYVGKGKVAVPPYRKDIMHEVDIIEDIGIMYGYENFTPLNLESYTQGGLTELQNVLDVHRILWIGAGFQEVLSPMLANKDMMCDKMGVQYQHVVEIENSMSLTYSCVRSALLPMLLEVLSKNRHVEYPQKLFEGGIMSKRKGEGVCDEMHVAVVSAHAGANFTEIKQLVEFVLQSAGVEFALDESQEPYFIEGRQAKVLVNKEQIGCFGEVHPKVLEKFGVQVPVVAVELSINKLEKENK